MADKPYLEVCYSVIEKTGGKLKNIKAEWVGNSGGNNINNRGFSKLTMSSSDIGENVGYYLILSLFVKIGLQGDSNY